MDDRLRLVSELASRRGLVDLSPLEERLGVVVTVFSPKFNRSFEGFRIGQHAGVESASGFRMIDVRIVFDSISNGPGTAFADVENAPASASLVFIDGLPVFLFDFCDKRSGL